MFVSLYGVIRRENWVKQEVCTYTSNSHLKLNSSQSTTYESIKGEPTWRKIFPPNCIRKNQQEQEYHDPINVKIDGKKDGIQYHSTW